MKERETELTDLFMPLQCFHRVLHLPAFGTNVLPIARRRLVMLFRHMTPEPALSATAELTRLAPKHLGFANLRIFFSITVVIGDPPPIVIVTIGMWSLSGILPSGGFICDAATAVWIPIRIVRWVVCIFADKVSMPADVIVLTRHIIRLRCGVHLFDEVNLDPLHCHRVTTYAK